MTLSVRFSPDLQGKLTEYCWLTGATKSLVLQQAVLEYLVRQDVKKPVAATPPPARGPSKAYKAFLRAGLIGALRDGAPDYIRPEDLGRSAAKEVVRRTAMAAIRRRRTPNGAARSAHSARSPGNSGHGIVCRPVRPE